MNVDIDGSASRRGMLAAVAIALFLASSSYAWYAASQSSADRAHLDEIARPLVPPPARLVGCRGSMDAACAQRAADRIDTTVAWLDEPAGYELEWMIANAHPLAPEDGVIATQYFLGPDGRGMFEVVTSVPPLPGGPARRLQSVSDGVDTGSMWLNERYGVASIEWAHDGIKYLITAQPRPWAPSAVLDAWKTIRYASPTEAH